MNSPGGKCLSTSEKHVYLLAFTIKKNWLQKNGERILMLISVSCFPEEFIDIKANLETC